MFAARRGAVRTAQRLRTGTQRRYESSHGDHGHAHAEVNESMGKNFYIALVAIPLSLLAYNATTSEQGTKPYLTKLIEKYTDAKEKWVARNTLHTKMIEQAAFDRNLFQSSPGSKMIDLKFPEQFNQGSPYNQSAGHNADLSELIAHYEKKNREMEEKGNREREEASK